MPNLFPEKNASTVAEYVNALSQIRGDRILWFRGQVNEAWTLTPGLARGGSKRLAAEAMLLTRFRQNALPLVPAGSRVNSDWDWLLLMQHYGVPTRLLDWTENALAGLYFAVVAMDTRRGGAMDGCVWVLDPVALNAEANIAPLGDEIPTLGVGDSLDEYLPGKVAEAVNTRPPVAVLAMRMFPRLVAQAGVFTIIHRATEPIEQIKKGAYVGRICIPRAAKPTIARELADLGITRLTLFPELESVAILARSFLR